MGRLLINKNMIVIYILAFIILTYSLNQFIKPFHTYEYNQELSSPQTNKPANRLKIENPQVKVSKPINKLKHDKQGTVSRK